MAGGCSVSEQFLYLVFKLKIGSSMGMRHCLNAELVANFTYLLNSCPKVALGSAFQSICSSRTSGSRTPPLAPIDDDQKAPTTVRDQPGEPSRFIESLVTKALLFERRQQRRSHTGQLPGGELRLYQFPILRPKAKRSKFSIRKANFSDFVEHFPPGRQPGTTHMVHSPGNRCSG